MFLVESMETSGSWESPASAYGRKEHILLRRGSLAESLEGELRREVRGLDDTW